MLGQDFFYGLGEKTRDASFGNTFHPPDHVRRPYQRIPVLVEFQ